MNDVSRAFVDAVTALDAFFIVDYGQVVDHFYSALRAVFGADTATDTALGAGVHNFLAATLGRAFDVHERVCWYFGYQKFRTRLGALAALDTLFFVDLGNAVHDVYGIVIANAFAAYVA